LRSYDVEMENSHCYATDDATMKWPEWFDCSGKTQKQFNSKLQTRFLVREDILKA
jgi:hypothetical protein